MTPTRLVRYFTVFALLIALLPSLGHAGTWVAFQNSYTRGNGAPVTVTNTFTLLNPATQYTLKAFNGGLENDTTELVSYSVVYLNGVQVVGPANFNQNVAEVYVTISPGLTNTLSVQVRGKPGGVLTIQVIGVDNDPPTITASVSPSPNATGWNNSPVTVTFTCSDKTSGVASCPSPVTVSTEGANQVVSGTATDLAGNTATTSVTINLDMTPPTITGTINPPPDSGGYNSGPVTVTLTCADALSGVASCSPPVSFTNEGPNQTTTGTAVDVAGNTATTTVTVNISLSYFKIRSWQTNPSGDPLQTGKCLDYGSSASGATVFLNDCANAHPVRVVELPEFTFPDGQVCQFEDGQTPPNCFHHEVVLYAGSLVIGIHNPPTNTLGGPPPPISPQAEYALELQSYNPNLATTRNQIFALDGDSIILESSRPYVSTAGSGLCPPAFLISDPNNPSISVCATRPPQLVVQVEKARGANGSPLVVAVRNLGDNEFWDFVPSPGSRPYPTTGFISAIATAGASPSSATPITTNWQLWNALCLNPQADTTQTPPAAPTSKCSSFNVGWGSVVVVAGSDPKECTSRPDVGPCIEMSNYPPITIPAGVTIRGDRRGTLLGPQLFASYSMSDESFPCNRTCMLLIQGDYARVTGLRAHGQSRSTDPIPNPPGKTYGIWVSFAGPNGSLPSLLFNLATVTEFIATIDHNDMSDWMDSAVTLDSPFSDSAQTGGRCGYTGYADLNSTPINTYPCDEHTIPQTVPYSPSLGLGSVTIAQDPVCPPNVICPPPTLANTRVARNFLHHNMRDDGGYGVAMGNEGGRALIEGNTFLSNRHDITAAGEPHSEYRASHNLVLSYAYDNYGGFFAPFIGRLQDFDMHGTSDVANSLYVGGAGGYYVEIDGNTFLGTNGHDYVLRGYPDINTYYHHNVSRRNEKDAIHFIHCIDILGCVNDYQASDFPISPSPPSSDNQFADSTPPYTNPTAQLGVGDFDGDGDDDLFLATGNTWFYSPGGAREWRYLNSAPDTIDQLLFGDFDGDGRTDVVALRDGNLVVSWGGISAFEVLVQGPLPCGSISDMAVGDFNGDGKPDIFCADGTQWWIWYGGSSSTSFVQGASYGLRRSALLFGDFDHDGTTDVFGVVNGGWYYSKSATGAWADGLLQTTALPNTNGNALTIGDFNGDGIPDVATLCTTSNGPGWQISSGGTQPWTPCSPFGSSGSSFSLVSGPVGHFSGGKGADILLWSGNDIWSFPGGTGPAQPLSSQDMR